MKKAINNIVMVTVMILPPLAMIGHYIIVGY